MSENSSNKWTPDEDALLKAKHAAEEAAWAERNSKAQERDNAREKSRHAAMDAAMAAALDAWMCGMLRAAIGRSLFGSRINPRRRHSAQRTSPCAYLDLKSYFDRMVSAWRHCDREAVRWQSGNGNENGFRRRHQSIGPTRSWSRRSRPSAGRCSSTKRAMTRQRPRIAASLTHQRVLRGRRNQCFRWTQHGSPRFARSMPPPTASWKL